jgi:hypothetical protein
MLWAGRIISALPVLLMVFGGTFGVLRPAVAAPGLLRYGYPERLLVPICIVEIACDYLRDSAHLRSWSDFADRLSWRRNRHARTSRRGVLPAADRRRAGLGRTVFARRPAARAHPCAKLVCVLGEA